ncbi:hypothetical protein Tco_0730397 [Tanacetum coccineum]|uniref:Uncharacterized protein n=1 Tax=Tanacetum coccineum TaxID=301880 RepID=A0ABQ4YSW0_9ASTR
MVISSPCLTDIKNWLVQSKRLLLASPKQMALGKDFLNPLIVDSLLKTIWLSMHHVIAMKHWLFQSKRLLVFKKLKLKKHEVSTASTSVSTGSRVSTISRADDENPPPVVTPTQQAPHTMSTIKLHILKKGEYDIWAMKMEHYLTHTDYPIWEVIQRVNGPDAIKSKFGGNDESKKMQKYILKQQFEGFSLSNSEGLHKGYDRFQSLLSQLEIHGACVSTEDANQKFLRSLPSSGPSLLDHKDQSKEWTFAVLMISTDKS